MTERLFDQDSFISEFTGVVISVLEDAKGYRIALDRTAFFPEGGGQSSDTGTLGGFKVTDVQEHKGIIYHLVSGKLSVGERVQGVVDFAERFTKMQQHTGEHIVSGLVHQRFGYDNVGFRLGNEICTLDFNGPIEPKQLLEIEQAANEAVFQNIAVEVFYPDADELSKLSFRSKIEIDGQIRLVRIKDYDLCACCAPHLTHTGMVGIIKLIDCQNYKGGVRITMVSGRRALTDYNSKEQNVKRISSMLSAREDLVSQAVDRLAAENEQLRLCIRERERRLIKYRAAEIDSQENFVCLFEPEYHEAVARELVNHLVAKGIRCCAVFYAENAGEHRYVIGSDCVDVRPLGQKLNLAFDGRGGGQAKMVQGMLSGREEKIREYLETQWCH